ncbi:MAG: NAD-dependent epimerase/dehydratase family protein [Planctomycetota bacterium]|jgi:nucleoside-diphosphate-sugar epimerase
MRVALTGISGFIGSNIARHLKDAGHGVTGLIRSTSRRDHIEPLADRLVVGDQSDDAVWPALLDGADCIIHNSLDWTGLKDPTDLDRHLQSNVVGAIRLLEAAAPRPFIFMSSVAVHHDIRPRWEGVIDEDHPLRPGTLYGAAKSAVEDFLWAARIARGQACVALRPCAVYGIDPTFDRSIGVPIIRRLQAGKPFTRQGGGKFVHVEDVAAATVAAASDEHAPAIVNLADCYARWSDLAHMAADILGVDASIDDSSPPEPKNQFSKAAAQSLGVALDRGHGGIRAHLEQVIAMLDDH